MFGFPVLFGSFGPIPIFFYLAIYSRWFGRTAAVVGKKKGKKKGEKKEKKKRKEKISHSFFKKLVSCLLLVEESDLSAGGRGMVVVGRGDRGEV
jgi:H+/gluconate symporter-like permease